MDDGQRADKPVGHGTDIPPLPTRRPNGRPEAQQVLKHRRSAVTAAEERAIEFLVEIELNWPKEMDPEEKARVLEEERKHGAMLSDSGHLQRLWRIPGKTANQGLWQATDETELRRLIGTLPATPWVTAVTVQPLEEHPADPGRRDRAE